MNETITITGNIATEPEHKHTAGGVSITTFRVASGQRRYDRQSGGWVDAATNWYTVSTFRSLADHAFNSLRKGDRVLLTGRLRVRDWDTGAKKGTTVEIDAEAIGHDLLWGNSRFEKERPSATTLQSDTLVDPGQPADEWAAPGVGEQADGEWPVAAVPDHEAEPPALELAGAETPF
jgi:single-strand DNA-binding protein